MFWTRFIHETFSNVTKLQQELLELIKTALTGETSAGFALDAINWKELFKLAARQGVKGVVWTAIQDNPHIAEHLSMEEKLEWWGHVRIAESKLKGMFNKSAEFASLLSPIPCVALKGVDYARYWPNPRHREFGDLDCWCVGQFEESNRRSLEIGASVEYEEGGKHTHTHYKGMTIENHQYFTDRRLKSECRANEILMETIGRDFKEIEGTKLLSPNASFSALFMTLHAHGHFIPEGIALRHVLDWYFFLRAEADNVDWTKVIPAMKEMRIWEFARCMTQICNDYIEENPKLFKLFELAEDQSWRQQMSLMVLEDILGEQPDVYDMRLRKKALRILRRSKRMFRFRKLMSESYIAKMWQSLVYNSVTGIKPKLE